MNAIAEQIKLLQHAGKILDNNLIDEWTKQGHHLTGAWEKSVHGMVVATGNVIVLTGTMAGYGVYVDEGVSAERIPYGGASAGKGGTGAGTSKYITGLYNFWKLRGLNDKEALRAAFATAKTQKKEGMSTVASGRFSQTGKRQQFIAAVTKVVNEGVNDVISDGLDAIIDKKYHETESETI